jgi:antirestriction protein ArdC
LVRNEGTTVVKNLLNSVSVIFPKKEPTGDFKPLTLDNVADKTTKNLGLVSKRGVNFPVNISYAVEGNELRIYEAQKYRRFLTDFEFFGAENDDKGVRIENPKNFSNFKEFESKEEMLKVLNSLKKQVEGYDDNLGIDVEISTAHKYKGGQSPRVLIWDDFPVPQPDMQNPGQIKFPSKEDVNLAYVAITRAMESIELGSLAWILDYTKEEDESPRLLPEEEIFAMKIPTDPVAISEEEAIQQVQETIKNDDNRSDMVADAIIAAMEKGSVAWRDYVVGGSGFLPMNGIGGNEYRGSNMLYLAAVAAQKGYKDNRWMTFKQAKDNGGFVKKGEKSTKIIFVRKGYREVNRPDGTTEKKMFYTPPKVFDVFNVEQTEGVNLPANVVREPVDVSEGETLLMNAYKNRPAVIFEPRKVAGYSSSDDTVRLPMRDQFVSAQDLFETLAHEFAHSTGSASRLDRTDLTDKYKTHLDSRGEEELIAEISVSMIASRLGVKMDFENSVAYIASWLPALKNDKSIIVRAARKAQAAVDLILGKEGDEESQEVTPDSPVGEGVGSEGRTGEDIAQDNLVEDAGLKPEPDLGEQGRSGEEISREVESDKSPYETPKNIDPDAATSKVTYNGKISDSWENFVFQDGPKAQDNLGIEGGVGAAAKRILEVDDFIVDRDEIGTYVSDIFKKYGYGDKAFVLHDAKDSDKILKKNGIEAGVTRAMTDTIPENHPFYKKPIPMLLIKSKGAKPVALLHEIAHMMSGNWIQGGGGGHSQDWYATYLALLDGEGYTREANLLRFTVYKPEEGDNGAIVKRG